MILVEWVGGPWDGEQRELPDGTTELQWAEPPKVPGCKARAFKVPVRRTRFGFRLYWNERNNT
jgi:hypothetical protein